MARKIQHKRGLKENLPTLDIAEIAFTTDTKEVFIGTSLENVQIANISDIPTDVSDLTDTTAIISSKATTNLFNTSITTTWVGSEAPFTQVIELNGILKDEVATVDIDLSNASDFAEEEVLLEEWVKIYRIVATDDNEITIYAKEVTTETISITIKVVR